MKEKHDNLDPELLLTQYLDGELGADERRQVQRRLETDADFLAQAKLYETLDLQLDSLAKAQVPGVDYDLQRQQIMASIERKMLLAPRGGVSLFLGSVFRVAAIAAMAVVAVSLYLHFASRPPNGPTPPAVSQAQTANGGIEVAILQPGVSKSLAEAESFPVQLAELPPLAPHGQQVAQASPGTVIASFGRPRPGQGADVFMFLPTESSADSGDIK